MSVGSTVEREFSSSDQEYVDFIRSPPAGFILNVPRNASSKWDWFKVHRSSCREIGAQGTKPSRGGPWIDPETYKVFSDQWDEILAAYTRRRPADRGYLVTDPDLFCQKCKPAP